jgi:hypothetical protein
MAIADRAPLLFRIGHRYFFVIFATAKSPLLGHRPSGQSPLAKEDDITVLTLSLAPVGVTR